MSKREVAKIAKEIKSIRAQLDKSGSDLSGDLKSVHRDLKKTFDAILKNVAIASQAFSKGDYDSAYESLSNAEGMSEDLEATNQLRGLKQDAQAIIYSQPGRNPWARK